MPSHTCRLASVALVVLLGGGRAHAQPAPVPPSVWASLLAGPSPLDHLDPARIPAEEWAADLPDDVVAVIGSRHGRHGGPVTCVAYSPDGKWIASGGADGFVRIWDAATLEAVGVLDDCEGVQGLAFSPDGKRLAAGGYTKVGLLQDQDSAWLRLWDVGAAALTPAGRLGWESARVVGLAFAPDGKTVVAGMQTAGLVAAFDEGGPRNGVQLVDLSGGSPRDKELKAGGTVRPVAFSPGSRSVAAGGSSGINLWDLGAERGTDGAVKVLFVSAALAAGLCGLGVLARLSRLYVRRHCKECRLRVALGYGAACLGSLLGLCLLVVGFAWLAQSEPEWPPRRGLPVPAGDWQAVAFSPDGRRLAAGGADGKVWLWDVSGPAPREEARLEGHTKTVLALAFSPDGRTLASVGGDSVTRLWDLQGPPRTRAAHRGDVREVRVLAFAPDGRSLVTGGRDGLLRGWEVGETLRQKDGSRGRVSARSLAFAADGRTLLLGCADRSVRLWDLGGPAPRERRAVQGLGDVPWRLAPSPDGRLLAVSHDDNTVRLWDLGGEVPRERAVLRGVGELDGRDDPGADLPFGGGPRVRFSPDGKFLLGVRREWRLWDVRRAAPREVPLPPQRVYHPAAVFSPDGRTLAVVDAERARTRLWDLGDGRPREVGTLGKWGLVPAFSPDGRRLLAVNGDEGEIAVWEWDLGSRRLTRQTALEGEEPGLLAGLVHDGRTVAAVTDVRTRHLVVWSAATGKRLGEYHLPGSVGLLAPEPLALAPDGRHLAVVTADGAVYVLRIGARGRGGPGDHYRRGLLLAGHNDHERAIAAFSEAIRLDPRHARAYYQRGLAHAARGDYAEAKKDLDRAIELDPKLGRRPPR